jgi:hypothetical protein
MEYQATIYRRFKSLYSTTWAGKSNPQDFEKTRKESTDAEKIDLEAERERIKKHRRGSLSEETKSRSKQNRRRSLSMQRKNGTMPERRGSPSRRGKKITKKSRRKTPTSASWCQTTASADSSTYSATLPNCWTRS